MRLGPIKLLEKRVIGPLDNPLLIRYVLFRVPWFGIWIHKLCRSDYERATHDHPFAFISIILRGGYKEAVPCDCGICKIYPKGAGDKILNHIPGAILYRPATWRHRVIIDGKPSWNLVLVGRRTRKWGFWPKGKWCWWRTYNLDSGICEEEIINFGNND